MHEVVIRNGTIICDGRMRRGDVGITNGRVSALGKDLAADREVDARGCWVIPGGVDIHVHLQMALGGRVSSDSFSVGTVAAACGGTTTVIDFVDPHPGQSMLEALAARRAEADGQVAVDYGLHMTVPTWHAAQPDAAREFATVVAAGCSSFKLYQAYDRMQLDDVALLRILQAAARSGGVAVLHSETGPVLEELRRQALAAGHDAPIWHERTRPARLEATAVARAIELAHLAGCPLHIFHVGCAESVAAIAAAARGGYAISGETCPQYLLLTAEEHLGGPQGELYICAPPLRSRRDQDELWAALADGRIDVVSTDHCPWTAVEKVQPNFSLVPGGVPSIEARLALIHHFGVNRGRFSPTRWVEICCTNPAQRMRLARKGRLAMGYDADVVVFDPALSVTLSPATLHESAGWTPYAGITVDGWPRTVMLRGETIVADAEPVLRTQGQFVPRIAMRP